MSEWLVEARSKRAVTGRWKETQDEASFVRVIGRIKTAHTRHRGYWWNGDNPDEEQSLSFVRRPKPANRPIHCVARCPLPRSTGWSGPCRVLSALPGSELHHHRLWWCVSGIQLSKKRPCGSWQADIWIPCVCSVSRADAKTIKYQRRIDSCEYKNRDSCEVGCLCLSF